MEIKKIISEITVDARERVDTFFDLALKNMAFLEHYGYTDVEVRIAKQYVVKNTVEIVYRNHKFDRVVVVNFQPTDINEDDSNYLSVNIYNSIKIMYKHIVFSLYIKKYRPEIDTSLFTYVDKNLKSSFEENMQAALAGYSYFLQEIGMPILDGTEWEDGVFFDISSAQKMLYDVQKRELYDDEEEKDKPDS